MEKQRDIIEELSGFSLQQLEKEVSRRNAEKDRLPDPKPQEEVDLRELYAACKDYLTSLVDGNCPEDFKHWVYEEAMNAVYGTGIWEWIHDHS